MNSIDFYPHHLPQSQYQGDILLNLPILIQINTHISHIPHLFPLLLCITTSTNLTRKERKPTEASSRFHPQATGASSDGPPLYSNVRRSQEATEPEEDRNREPQDALQWGYG